MMRIDRHLRVPVVLTVILTLCIRGGATDYYVDAKNANASDGNSGTASLPWKTISKANQTLVAGDTVYIRGGIYSQGVAPGRSGHTPVSRITYAAYPGEYVLITGNLTGITLNSRSWIVVSGINFTNVAAFGSALSATNNVITNCLFAYQTGSTYCGFNFENSAQSNFLTRCTFHHWGSTANASGDMVNFGDESDMNDHSSYNIIDSCTLYSAGHALINFRSGFNVLRNSWLHNEIWSSSYGMRCLITQAYDETTGGGNLIENNRFAFAGPYYASPATSGIDLRTDRNIVRRNLFYNNSDAGIMCSEGSSTATHSYPYLNHVYNNTFYTNGWVSGGNASHSAFGFFYFGLNLAKSNCIVNNIFSKHAQTFWYYHVNASDQILTSNWLDSAANPQFTDVTTPYTATTQNLPDLSLRTNSPCIDAGAWLTTAASSGSGTALRVADAGYFFAGIGNLVPGDTIQLEDSTATARITAIIGNTLTLNTRLTWTNGQGIALPYNGNRPDIGAYESGAGYPITPITPPGNLRVLAGP